MLYEVITDGSIYALCGISTDITERKQFEEQLLRQEHLYKSVFEQAAVGIARVATDGHWLEVNQRMCDIVGYDRSTLLATDFQHITHPEDLDIDLEYVHSYNFV